MESGSISAVQPQSVVNLEGLNAFEHTTSFNLFLFSRNSVNLPHFLLHKTNRSQVFNHWSGIFDRHDPNIYFSIIREFITQNRGLLYTPNLKHFQSESANPIAIDDLVLEDLTGTVRPQKGFSPSIDDVCRLLSETPYIFQDQRGCVTYFIEFPLLNLETINDAAQKKGLETMMRYYTFEEILDAQNEEISNQLKACFENSNLRAYAKTFIVDAEPIVIKERYAIISCEPKIDTYMMHSLHYPIYKKHGEHWSFYKAHLGEFPTDEEIKTFKGVIIPGSSCSAYADCWPWYKQLFEIIDKIVNGHKQINLLCICFGAQVTAQALGGKVEKMKRPFIRGGDQLTMEPSFYTLDYIKKSGVESSSGLLIGQSHGDHIVNLPPGAILHGSSANTNVECYTIGNNVLAFQGHPEYNEAWTAGTFYRNGKKEVEDYDRYADEYMAEKFPAPITRKDLTTICYTFLKKDSEEVNYGGI